MKKVKIAVVAALFILSQVFTLAFAAPTSGSQASIDCGDTYVVQRGDYLSKIASNCGYTLSSVLALNPQIKNANLIYAGQVINLSGAAAVGTSTTSSGTSSTTYSGSARVTISRTRAVEGDDITVTVTGFPDDTDLDYRVGQYGQSYSTVYDGETDSDGEDSQVIEIPSDADVGEYWVVNVTTTSETPQVSVTSHTIYIASSTSTTTGTGTTSSGSATVSLSATTGEEGDSITVYVKGFPKNASIDYRIGEYGENYTLVYDATVDSSGSDDFIFTLPSDADEGEYWVVKVLTTDQVSGVTVTSHKIYIDD